MTLRTETKTMYYTSGGEAFDTMEEAEKQELIDAIIEHCRSYTPPRYTRCSRVHYASLHFYKEGARIMDICHCFLAIVCVCLLFSLQRSKKRADVWEDVATRLYRDGRDVLQATKELEANLKTIIVWRDE